MLTNPKAPRVRAAARLAKRAFRERDGRFLAEGPQACREAARSPGALVELYLTAEARERHPELVESARRGGTDVQLCTEPVVAALADTVTPQGMVGVCALPRTTVAGVVAGSPRLLVVLAHVRDPGNAGTIVRTADAAGADAVVLTDASVDPYNPKAVRATAGSLWHLPVATGAPLSEVVTVARASGLRVLAADGAGERDLDALADDGSLAAPTAWVFGNEAWGLPEADQALADEVVRIPVHGRAESLNLATAAAVCLYASARAHRRVQPAGGS